MRHPPIAALSRSQAEQVTQDLRYLNTHELRSFCDRHEIPYTIMIERPDGSIVRSRDRDRKGVVIERVLHFLRKGVVAEPTIFRRDVVADGPLGRPPVAADRVLYGQYTNGDRVTLELLKSLTGGRFEFGAVAQEVLRAHWSRNDAPTYAQFAARWEAATQAHTRPNPEWAFLSDRADRIAGPDWKQHRERRAAAVIALLEYATD